MSEGQPRPQALRFSQGRGERLVMNRKGPLRLMHMQGQVSKDLATFFRSCRCCLCAVR